jgi:hypothetical protein
VSAYLQATRQEAHDAISAALALPMGHVSGCSIVVYVAPSVTFEAMRAVLWNQLEALMDKIFVLVARVC